MRRPEALRHRREALERVRKVESVRSQELADNIASQQELLHGYRVLDPGSSAVAIPIERAQLGLPLTQFTVG